MFFLLWIEEDKSMTELGNRIKENRMKLGLTQKELADKLYVTPQAVSRWENDGIEPPIVSLRKMSSIFQISLDDLIGSENNEQKVTKEIESFDEIKPAENEKEAKHVSVVTPPAASVKAEIVKPSLVTPPASQPAKSEETQAPAGAYGICDKCHKLLKGPNDIHDINTPAKRVFKSRGRSYTVPGTVERLCSECYAEHVKEVQAKKKAEIQAIKDKARLRRQMAYGLGPLCSIVLSLILCWIVYKCTSNVTATILVATLGSVYFFPFFACLFLNNNCIFEIFADIAEIFFVKFPGIIFSFDLDGLAFLVIMKILFAVLGFAIGLLGFCAGTAVASFIALFVVIPSFLKSKNYPEETR